MELKWKKAVPEKKEKKTEVEKVVHEKKVNRITIEKKNFKKESNWNKSGLETENKRNRIEWEKKVSEEVNGTQMEKGMLEEKGNIAELGKVVPELYFNLRVPPHRTFLRSILYYCSSNFFYHYLTISLSISSRVHQVCHSHLLVLSRLFSPSVIL